MIGCELSYVFTFEDLMYASLEVCCMFITIKFGTGCQQCNLTQQMKMHADLTQRKDTQYFAGNPNVMVCERGTMFGYSDLIVDPRNIVLMRDCSCPVTVDITHALQQPAGKPLEVRFFHVNSHKIGTSRSVEALQGQTLRINQCIWKLPLPAKTERQVNVGPLLPQEIAYSHESHGSPFHDMHLTSKLCVCRAEG